MLMQAREGCLCGSDRGIAGKGQKVVKKINKIRAGCSVFFLKKNVLVCFVGV